MKRLNMLMVSAVAVLSIFLSVSVRVEASQPNILFILADDMGWADNSINDPALYSPTIQSLAEGGVWLDQCYVQPQCTPTRVAFLTGRYPARLCSDAMVPTNLQTIPFDTMTVAKMLKAAGYETSLSGKWHLGSRPQFNPLNFGFDQCYGALAGACGVYDHRYRLTAPTYSDTWHLNGKLIPGAETPPNYSSSNTNLDLYEGYHSTDLLTDNAVSFISKPHTKPFFAYVPYTAVHTPFGEESKWFNDPDGKIAQISDPSRRLMAASVYHLDDSIGRLIQALEDNGLRQNTLVVFCSDNGGIHTARPPEGYPEPAPSMNAGFSSNYPLRSGKMHVYEGGTRVPAFVNWPGTIAPGGTMSEPMHIVDWMPTFARLAGVTPDPSLQLDGIDIWDQITQGTPMPQRDIYIAWGTNWERKSVRKGDWKILDDGSGWELYKIGNIDQETADPADPTESTNLASTYPDKVNELVSIYNTEHTKDNTSRLVSCWLDAPEQVQLGETFSVTLNSTHSLSGVEVSDFEVIGATVVSLSNKTLNLTATAAGVATVMFKANSTNLPNDRSQVAVIEVEPPTAPVGTGSTSVSEGANLTLSFDQDVVKDTGNIVVRLAADDSVVDTIDVTSAAVTVNGSSVSIDPVADLIAGTTYYIEIDAGAFESLYNVPFAGFSGSSDWSFTVRFLSFVAYHDLGALTGEESTGNITTHQSGAAVYTNPVDTSAKELIRYEDGSATGIYFSINRGNGMDGRNSGQFLPPAADTPADSLFTVTGLNLNNGSINVGNTPKGNPPNMTFTLTGLNPASSYDLALYGDRQTTLDGVERFTLGGADAAVNISSSGIVDTYNTEMETRYNGGAGNPGDVIRWTGIKSGADGTITVFVDPGIISNTNLAYVGAIRLEEEVSVSTLLAPEPITWLGMPTVLMVDSNGPYPFTYTWGCEPNENDDPNLAITFTPDPLDASITTFSVTDDDPSGQMQQFTITVQIDDGFSSQILNPVQIDVYDSACAVTRQYLSLSAPTDINQDCITNIEDLAELAGEWLVDYAVDTPLGRTFD